MSDDDDERQTNPNGILPHEGDNRRRLSDIKTQLQGLMRQKKKYDEDKLKQDAEFLQSEINDLRNSIADVNKEINNHTQTKKRLHVEMTNLRSRARLRYTNLSNALRDKRRYELELKKENKTEEYRALAREGIRLIDAAIPILKEEEDYKAHLKTAEDAQLAATVKRKKLEESLNRDLRKQADIKQLLSENAEKLPQIEATIDSLRCERERLLSSSSTSSTHTKKPRRRLPSNQQRSIDSPTTPSHLTPIRLLASLQEDTLKYEKEQNEGQLNKINTLITYFREKLTAHGLQLEPICSTPSSELISPLYHSLTPHEEQTILSSYMEEHDDSEQSLTMKTSSNEPSTAIAMKLPRNFAPLNLNQTTTNEIIHSPFYDGNEIQYKKEFSSDMINKYGGQPKKTLLTSNKKQKRNRKPVNITHNPQMIQLYDNIRLSSGSSDTLPPMPMYEFDLQPTIQALELMKQSLESYLNELNMRTLKISIDDEQQLIEDEDIRDSVLDSISETSSSLMESTKVVLQSRLSSSSDERKTLASSSPPPEHSSNPEDSTQDSRCLLTSVDELNGHSQSVSIVNPPIDRQTSDEGYRSVQNEQQQQLTSISNQNSPLMIRSKSYDCTDKVGTWLSNTTPSSLPKSPTFQPIDINDHGRISVSND